MKSTIPTQEDLGSDELEWVGELRPHGRRKLIRRAREWTRRNGPWTVAGGLVLAAGYLFSFVEWLTYPTVVVAWYVFLGLAESPMQWVLFIAGAVATSALYGIVLRLVWAVCKFTTSRFRRRRLD